MCRVVAIALLAFFAAALVPFSYVAAQAVAPLADPKLTPEQQQRLAEAKKFSDRQHEFYKQGRFGEAAQLARQVLAINQEVLGKKNSDTARLLNNVGFLLKESGDYTAARPFLEQALAVNQELLGDKDPHTAQSLGNLASLFESMGDYAAARPYYERALAIDKEVLGNKHASTARSLNNMGELLRAMGDYATARPYLEQALAIHQEVLGNKDPGTAQSLNNMGGLLFAMGDYAAARPYFEQALAIRQEALGDNHPALAESLNNLGALADVMADYAAARRYYERALAIDKALLGDKHPNIAKRLGNLGGVFYLMGDYAAALPYVEQDLAITQESLGGKHPDTATSLNNLGTLRRSMGDYAAARSCFDQSVAIRREALGNKHYNTATALGNLGFVHADAGDFDLSASCLAESVEILRGLQDAVFAVSSETESLQFVAQDRSYLDALVSVWRHTDRTHDDLYANLWPARAAVFQLAADRRRVLGSSTSPEVQRLYQTWLDTRREVARLTLAPASLDPKRRAARQEQLQKSTARKEELERQLAALIPEFAQERAKLRRLHTELIRALPPDAVFIDVLRYTRFEHDRNMPGAKGDSWTPCYVAFVLRYDQSVQRIDLGPAAPIDAAALSWRSEILAGKFGSVVNELRKLIWQPIAVAIPKDVDTVYLVPDGPLTLLPWAALPGSKPGTVLLEDYAIATVPNGQVLLEQLNSPSPSGRGQGEGNGSLLAVGNVQYDEVPNASPAISLLAGLRSAATDGGSTVRWPALPSTAKEIAEVEGLAGRRPMVKLVGNEASTARVVTELSNARWAVIATHGFFADPSLRNAMQMDEASLRDGFQGASNLRSSTGRNPLLLSGLVLAGANLPRPKVEGGVPQGDGGILTAEAIAGLNLSKMELAVLSACETGLGGVAGGEGVFGLQRAFHIAGCRNVIASLWKVDDQATAALMRLFYHKLWQENKPPIVALREAQLALYRHPEQIGKLATTRGLDFSETVKLADTARPAPRSDPTTRADTRLWAAFMLSGSGQ